MGEDERQEAAADGGHGGPGGYGRLERRQRRIQDDRRRGQGRCRVQLPPHHHLRQGRAVRREHQSRTEEDQPHVRRRRQGQDRRDGLPQRRRRLYHISHCHFRGDRSGIHNEGHDDPEPGRSGEAPGGGAPRRRGSRGGVRLQRNRLPGHPLRPLPEAVLPRVRRVRHGRLHIRQRRRGAAKVQPLVAQADGDAEEHHHRAEPQGPEPEHGDLGPRLQDPRGAGPRQGFEPDVPGPSVEDVLEDGVHDVLLRGPRRRGGVAGVERGLRSRHALLRGVHELRARGRGGQAGVVAGVPGDQDGGGGGQVHRVQVHQRLGLAAFDWSGVCSRFIIFIV